MNIERMKEALQIISEECNIPCRDCVFVTECSPGYPIGEIAENMLDLLWRWSSSTQKEDAE